MMSKSLRMPSWYVYGLINYPRESVLFSKMNKIEILLIFESHVAEKNCL